MKRNRTLFSFFERKCLQCEPQRVLDHYFNVRLGVSGPEMELARRLFCLRLEEASRR